MVYAIKFDVAFTTANRRNQVFNVLDSERQSKLRYGVDVMRSQVTKIGEFGILGLLRFINEADRDAFVAAMLQAAVGQFAPVAGSWYAPHACPDDSVGGGCSETRVVW